MGSARLPGETMPLEHRFHLGIGSRFEWSRGAAASSACLACHDGSVPSGVVMPSGVTNIDLSWSPFAFAPSYHGAYGTGAGFGGGLIARYTRGVAPNIPCVTCHDAHGSASLYHVPAVVEGQTGISVASSSGAQSLCGACHVGNVGDWHAPCVDCHESTGSGHSYGPPAADSDCLACHGHGKTWQHWPTTQTYEQYYTACHGCGSSSTVFKTF